MALTSAKAFDEFHGKLLPTNAQQQAIRDRRKRAARYLAEAFPATSTLPVKTTRMMGSAARDTIIRPVDDIDVLAEFRNKDQIFEKYRKDSQAFLYRIRQALNAKTQVKSVGARGQAVRLFYKDGLHVDIAPVFAWKGGGFALPAGDGRWMTTNPEAQNAWLERRDKELGHRLKRRVRFVKRWNSEHSSRLNSFHLEVMVADVFTSMSSNSRHGLWRFFEWAPGFISVQDPAGHGGDLSAGMSMATKKAVRKSFQTSHERAGRALAAEDAGDHREAIRLWRILLGDEFPAYG